MNTQRTAAAAEPFDPARAAQTWRAASAAAFSGLAGFNLPPERLAQIRSEYLQQATALWNQGLRGGVASDPADAPAPLTDRRFASAEWARNPVAAAAAQFYLLNARTLTQLAEGVQGDAKTQARIRFAVQQWVEAASPSNVLALNADALHKAVSTRGASLSDGLQHLLQDVRKGHVSQTDEDGFEVGRNLATTEGSVVFENELFQLVEYRPLTPQVFERPMLFVPPCINKFYILDLQPDNSFIRYTVEQGHRCFVMSWRNPDASLADRTWDDYIEHGPITAIRTVQALTGARTINTLGFCVGGTLLSTALAVLAARGEQPAQSLTLLTTLLDFEDTGILDIFVDEAAVRLRELTLGPEAPGGPALLKGRELATTFSFLRPNDLVWNYVVGNYLKGETPPPFDLLYWNSDSTNLPGPMYCWYLRHTYLQNELKVPGRLQVCGVPVDLGAVRAPVFLYASREDHIVPWTSAYASVALFPGQRRFVLGASGHIAGVINPPAKRKRSFWTQDALPPSASAWLDGATEHAGSWWPTWSDWTAAQGGRRIPAPRAPGGRGFRAIEPAPGRYVQVQA